MLSVVIPAYNEAENISVTAIRIDTVLSFATIDYELIFVDDGSTDETFATITTLSNDKQVRGLKFSRNFGKEAAVMAGLNCAKGDCCAVLDCDLQHPPQVPVSIHPARQQDRPRLLKQRVNPRRQQHGSQLGRCQGRVPIPAAFQQ